MRVELQQRDAHPSEEDQSGSMNPLDFSRGDSQFSAPCAAVRRPLKLQLSAHLELVFETIQFSLWRVSLARFLDALDIRRSHLTRKRSNDRLFGSRSMFTLKLRRKHQVFHVLLGELVLTSSLICWASAGFREAVPPLLCINM